jgi:5-aminopentanamidase
VAAYQAPLLPRGSKAAIGLIRSRVEWCEAEGVRVLCCPEAMLGGLGDDVECPATIAYFVGSGEFEAVLAPLASATVTTILGFTEITSAGHLYNSAVVFHQGSVAGLYRKQYPAIRRSVYQAGDRTPVFTVGEFTFGVVICNDSNYPELGRAIAVQGAVAIFIPTNNSLPPAKADVVAQAREVDFATAMDNAITVIRADVAGRTGDRVSYGSSCIVDPHGKVIQAARPFAEDLLVAEIETAAPAARNHREWFGTVQQGVAADGATPRS